MCQVVAFIGVQREAQATFILTQMVAEKVGILGQVDGLQGKTTQALTACNGLGGLYRVVWLVLLVGWQCVVRSECVVPLALQMPHHQSLAWSHALVHP